MQCLKVTLCAVLLAGCASAAKDVQPAYISPLTYQDLSCEQLGQEAERLSRRALVLTGNQDKKRTKDAVATTAAVIIFWPAAFLVGGDDGQTAELAQVKGRFEAIEQTAIRKNCDLQIRTG